MNASELSPYFPLAAIGLVLLLAIAFTVYRAASMESRWASSIRGLLEQEGFRVQHMERRWLTRGPFRDLRPPGTKHHTEWLVRVIADDRQGTRRAGWVRWRKNWPGEAKDRWAAHWDEEPWSAAAARPTKGLSTRAFYGLMLVAVAAVLLAIGTAALGALP